MRRWVNVVVLALLAVVLLPVSASHAAASSSSAAASPAIPNPFEGCKDAPRPAKPLSPIGLKPETTSDGDPFNHKGVTLESVYGNGYTYATYDNGCKPGAGVMPNLGSGIGNFGMRVPAAMSSMSSALQQSVISPDWLEDIDKAVVEATHEARDSVWTPLVGLSMLLVGVLMLVLTRSGRLDGTITTGAWAVLVLTLVTFLANYPREATEMVDDVVRSATVTVADGFSGADDSTPAGPVRPSERESVNADRASAALAGQWDEVNRVTSYRTWLEGTFGDADSATAKKYGPRAFKASHLSWSEYDTVKEDPEGEGKKILDRKAKEYEEVADDVKEADSYAYSYFTGNEWMHRAGMSLLGVLGALCTMLFITVSTIGMAIGLIIIRVLVIFAPAMGVIFLLEPTREWALGLLSKVGKWVLLGPVLLFAGLVVLRVNSAIANSDGGLWEKLALTAIVSLVAWWLIRPMGGVPKLGVGRKMMGLVRMAVLGATAGAAASKASQSADKDDDESETHPDAPVRRTASDQPVALPAAHSRPALPQADETSESYDLGVVEARPVQLRREPVQVSQRAARDMSALPAGTTAGRTGALGRGPEEADNRSLPPAYSVVDDGSASREVSSEQDVPTSDAQESSGRRPIPVGYYTPVGRVADDHALPAGSSPVEQTPGQDSGRQAIAVDTDAGDYRVSAVPDVVPEGGSSSESGDYRQPQAPFDDSAAPAGPSTVDSPTQQTEVGATEAGATEVKSGRVLGHEEDLPESINESNVSYGPDGEPVYMVYRPEGSVTYRVQ